MKDPIGTARGLLNRADEILTGLDGELVWRTMTALVSLASQPPAGSPEAPDASDETRLAAGWVQQARCGDELPPKDVAGPSGWSPAPGAAGAWRYKGTTGSGVYTVWIRWLAPVEASGG